jgi:hypothetical protein
MHKYGISIYGFLIALVFYTLVVYFDIDLFEKFYFVMQDIEHLELDELVLPFLFFLLTIIFNLLRNTLKKKVGFCKTRIFEAASYTYKHIINDLLLKIVIHRISKKEGYAFSKDALLFYQKLEAETKDRMEELTHLKDLNEDSIRNLALPKSKRGVTEFV